MIYSVEVPAGPDRSEFLRDLEAVKRLHSPMAASRYVASLALVRAEQEVAWIFCLTEFQRQQAVDSIKRELWDMATAIGYRPMIRSIKISIFVKEDGQ
jgi:hypothetical protein